MVKTLIIHKLYSAKFGKMIFVKIVEKIKNFLILLVYFIRGVFIVKFL